MKTELSIGMCLISLVMAGGCTPAASTPDAAPPAGASTQVDGTRYLLTAEPAGAEDVIQVRQAAQDQDDVVVVGRIGGSREPWVEGRAAFSIVDNSLKACSDIEGDTCPAPWDYCCETARLPTSQALVKVVDENGDLVKTDARQLLNVKELQTVVVQGRAQRDEGGNLTVLARGIFVRE